MIYYKEECDDTLRQFLLSYGEPPRKHSLDQKALFITSCHSLFFACFKMLPVQCVQLYLRYLTKILFEY